MARTNAYIRGIRTKLFSSFLHLQGHNINSSALETEMLSDLRDICNRHSTPDGLNVTVFHPWFIYVDQYLSILPQTIQCILVTAGVMIVIALVLIPSPICSFWVSFSIVSIEVGVIGFMSLWGVRLDGVALINLIMCIGFSVDFSAHICYHYMTEDDKGSKDRIRGSLYALGVPILQGAGSTVVGVLGLAFAPSYLYVTFFKMIFLVILLGAMHGLILLPVLLSLFGPGACSDKFSNSSSKSTRSSGISTPTTISCGPNQSCYTVNLGYVPSGGADEFTPNPMVPFKGRSGGVKNGAVPPSHQGRYHKRHSGVGGEQLGDVGMWAIESKGSNAMPRVSLSAVTFSMFPRFSQFFVCSQSEMKVAVGGYRVQSQPHHHHHHHGGNVTASSGLSSSACTDGADTSSSSSPSGSAIGANRKRSAVPASRKVVETAICTTTATEADTSTSSSTNTTPKMPPVVEKKKEERMKSRGRHRNHDAAVAADGAGGREREGRKRGEGAANNSR